ncbi:MAG: sodium-coupled permease [Fuerstiella sp.]
MFRLTLLFALFVLTPNMCHAAEAAEAGSEPAGLTWIDWLIILTYAISTIVLGWWYGRRQTSTKEYFIGGGNMNPFFVGVSLFATLLSTISYLSMPGEAAGKGPVTLIGLLTYPVIFAVVAYLFIPVYMRQRATSAYELLELRLGLSVRLLGACMFLSLRLVWMMLLVYLAASAMTVMLGVDFWIIDVNSWTFQAARFSDAVDPATDLPGIFRWNGSELRIASIPVIVLITGIVSVTYTTLGGLRAVVMTDFMQSVLLLGGAWMVIGTVTWQLGGFSWIPTSWHSNWDAQPLFSTDPRTRVTMVGTFLSILTWYIATSAGDQTSVQRFMATRDAAAARRALATQLAVGAVVAITLHLVGMALLGFFQTNPDALPVDMSVKTDADKLFPRYVSFELPVGISGLVVAAMFAAAMSSIDSGVNSITAVVTSDFLERLGMQPKTEKGNVHAARLLALAIGIIVVLGSTYMKYIPGNITAVTNKTANLFTSPIFALFFFALFVRFAHPVGVWIGTVCGASIGAMIAFSGPLVVLLHTQFGFDPATFGVELMTRIDPETGAEYFASAVRELNPETGQLALTPRDPVSFQWIGPVSLIVNLVVGTVLSAVLNRGKANTTATPTERSAS